MIDDKAFQLSSANEGDRVVVARMSEYAENVAELLEYLGQRGVTPGAHVGVIEIAPLKGPLTLRIGIRTTSMSREVAQFVWVRRG